MEACTPDVVMKFNPSLYFDFLTPFYDSLFKLLLPRKKIRLTTLELLEKDSSENLVELGSGTGDLILEMAHKFPKASITAIDIDPKANEILKQKLRKKSISQVNVQQAWSYDLPFEGGSVDALFASLLFCNLPLDRKHSTLEEAKRVLNERGMLLIAEWGPPQTIIAKTGFLVLQAIGRSNITDLRKGMLQIYLQEHGFSATASQYINTLFGTLYFYRAVKLKN